MSNFNYNVFLPKVIAIYNSSTNNIKDDFKAMFQCFDKLEEELKYASATARDKSQKDKNAVKTLQSINEDETESPKVLEDKSKQSSESKTSTESGERRGSKKRSKHEVEGMESPEQEKRQKRNASVKAQSIISKQVNVNLSQKLRRENSIEKGKKRRGKNEDKENAEPLPIIQVKQEKISIPPEPEPMDVTSPEAALPINVTVKQETSKDDIAMPPPAAPLPKSRKGIQKEKSEESTDDESSSSRRTTSQRSRRTRKQTDTAPVQTAASNRSVRASSRATKQAEFEEQPVEPRPKRTRAKKVAEALNEVVVAKDTQASIQNETASPAEKPRPKRTRRVQKAAEKEVEKVPEATQPEVISPKDERISQPEIQSPLLPAKTTKQKTNTEKTKLIDPADVSVKNVTKNLNNNYDSLDVEKIRTQNTKNDDKNNKDDKINYIEMHAKTDSQKTKYKNDNQEIKELNARNKIDTNKKEINSNVKETVSNEDVTDNVELDKTSVVGPVDAAVTLSKDLDETMVLPNGVYNHAPVTPKAVRAMNETMILENNRETMVLDKQQHQLMNCTVVLDKVDTKLTNLTDDNSLITDDSDIAENTPPKKPPVAQPTSAVKEKVQQFEEMASRVTRTKTRAMAKKEEQPEEQTPPEKVSKVILSSETLTKMNSMIFNGKPPLVSKSASKPYANVPSAKPLVTASASKLSGINKAREADELRREREDARKKKEAILEAKRELQKKKREEKMAAAAAAREAAEKERRAAMEAAARERMEKQAHADQGKLERLKEAERKKLETARKVAETEERRKAEEQARQQRLADEQRRAEAARRKQLEEAETLKKEAAIMQKEMERKQKEFLERQRLKQRMEGDKILTPLKSGSPYAPMEPVYMLDGFQYLNSDEDEDEDTPTIPTPVWSTSERRRRQLGVQDRVASALVAALFSVRAHTPDLRDIFPNIERARLKRTSSAVWRTPPARLPVLRE